MTLLELGWLLSITFTLALGKIDESHDTDAASSLFVLIITCLCVFVLCVVVVAILQMQEKLFRRMHAQALWRKLRLLINRAHSQAMWDPSLTVRANIERVLEGGSAPPYMLDQSSDTSSDGAGAEHALPQQSRNSFIMDLDLGMHTNPLQPDAQDGATDEIEMGTLTSGPGRALE
jgi:hypothetical protein